jgi:hypothetical protein
LGGGGVFVDVRTLSLRFGVFNPLDYGAAGDGVAEDATAVSATIAAINAAGGGTLLIPGGKTFKVSSALTSFTVPFEIRGRGTIKSYVTGGASVLTVADGVQFWTLNDFTLTGSYNDATFITGASNAQACVGLTVGAGAGTTSRWAVNDVLFRGMQTGAVVDGFIVTANNWFFRECETGLAITNTSAAGAYDLGLRFENCRKDFAFTRCNTLILRQPLMEGVLSAGQHVTSTVDDCDSVEFIGGYMECVPARTVPYIRFGGTTVCEYVEFIAGSVSGVAVDVRPVVFDRVSSGRVAVTGSTGADHALFDTTANTGNIDIVYSKAQGVWPTDTGAAVGPVHNYFPNSNFDCWFRGWYDVYHDNVTRTQETTLVRRGRNAVKIQASTSAGTSHYIQFTLSGNGTTVAGPAVTAMRGKTMMIGAWVWVPDLPEFTSTDPSGTEVARVNLYATSDTDGAGAGLVNSDTASGGTYNHHAVKGAWNFLWSKIAIPAAATTLKIRVYLNRGGTLPDTDAYIVIDSIQIAEDKANFSDFVAGRCVDSAAIDATCAGGRVTMRTDLTTMSDATQTYEIGDRIEYLTPVAAGNMGAVCTTGGAGGTAVFKTFGVIAA